MLVCRCGYRAHQWHGRCPGCGEWDSLNQATEGPTAAATLVRLAEAASSPSKRLKTGISEFDRVLGGGLVPGSTVLLAGDPGIGKSTLALQAAAGIGREGTRVLLICGEERLDQVAARALRVSDCDGLSATQEVQLDGITGHVAESDVAIVDSIQTLYDKSAPGAPGSVSQVRSCAAALGRAARSAGTALILIGHVTKDGAVAGPKALEHLVDTVLTFEGDGGALLRTIRATKNRFGPTAEVGVFEMKPDGLAEVADVSGLFLGGRRKDAPGSAVGVVLEGQRAMAVEVQALTVISESKHTRRVGSAIDSARISVLAAVLEKRASVTLSDSDIYARIAGGFRSFDTALDLPLALAMAGSHRNQVLRDGLVTVGEVGLGGELRAVPGMQLRIAEAARLKFSDALVPPGTPPVDGIELQPVADILSALDYLARPLPRS
jgi:DNA repair protein RadA/Sms